MNASELPQVLRELADRIEAAEVSGVRCNIDFTIHGVSSRGELAKWAKLIGPEAEVVNSQHTNYLRTYPWRSGIGFGVHYTPGLLGGGVKTIVSDDKRGLTKLIAESEAPHA